MRLVIRLEDAERVGKPPGVDVDKAHGEHLRPG